MSTLQCPKCDELLVIPKEGSHTVCPTCGEVVAVVRRATPLSSVKAITSTPPVVEQAKGSFARTFGGTFGILAAIGLFVVLSAAGLAIWKSSNQKNETRTTYSNSIPIPPVATYRPERKDLTSGAGFTIVDFVRLDIQRVWVGNLRISRFNQVIEHPSKTLNLQIRLSTSDDSKKYDHESWSGTTLSKSRVIAVDDIGNKYQCHELGGLIEPVGIPIGHEPVQVGKPFQDLVILDSPVNAARWLDIDFIGHDGSTFRFRIPSSSWR